MNWNELYKADQLSEIDNQSKEKPVLIFKHSTRCSISAASLDRLERKWDDTTMSNVVPYFLDLISNKEISNTVAQKYAVDHQSPQILIIRDGKCIHDASHFGIDYSEVEEIVTTQPA